MRVLGLTLLLVLIGLKVASGQDKLVLPYPYVKVEHKITAERIGGQPATGNLRVLDYREVYYNGRVALLTVAAKKPVVAAVLLYTGAHCYIVNTGLTVPTDYALTLSTVIPEQAGLLRLLVFDRSPDSKTLAALAGRPMTATSPRLTGELWQRTLLRDKQASRTPMPWEDPLEYLPRLTGARSRWPYFLARIDRDYIVRAKDCTASYSGQPLQDSGGRMVSALWPLESSEILNLRFNIPRGLNYHRAILVLASDPASTEFTVRVNGFSVPVLPDMSTGVPVLGGIDIRGFLRSGANELELRPPTFGQGGRLRRAELWLE